MKYLVMDLETDSLFDFTKAADAPGQPRLCEISMLFVDEQLEIEREITNLIKPEGWTIDETSEGFQVNQITQKQLEADGVPSRDMAREYGSAIDERRIIVAFNAPFDIKMMRAELRRAGFPDRYMQTRYICVMQGCRSLVDARTETGKKKVPTMDEACIFFGFEPEAKPHRAAPGATRALWILRALRDRGMFPAFKDPYDRPAKKKN